MAASRKAMHPRRSCSRGSGERMAAVAMRPARSDWTSSTTARKRPCLVPKWWERAPRVTPASLHDLLLAGAGEAPVGEEGAPGVE